MSASASTASTTLLLLVPQESQTPQSSKSQTNASLRDEVQKKRRPGHDEYASLEAVEDPDSSIRESSIRQVERGRKHFSKKRRVVIPELDPQTRSTCNNLIRRALNEMHSSPLSNNDPVARVYAASSVRIMDSVSRVRGVMNGPLPSFPTEFYEACVVSEAMDQWRRLCPTSDKVGLFRMENAFPFLAFTEMGTNTLPYQLPSDEQLVRSHRASSPTPMA